MLGKGSSDSQRAAFGAPRAPAVVTGGGGHPLRAARPKPEPRFRSAPPPAEPRPLPKPPSTRKRVQADERRGGQVPQSLGRRVTGWGVLVVFFGIVAVVVVALVVPRSLLWIGTETAEVTGRVTLIEHESKRRRGRAQWVLGDQQRVFVKLAPYSFGFVVPCPGQEACDGQIRRLRAGQQVTLTVDKAAFEELTATNHTVDPSSRDINRISRNMVAIETDRRTVSTLRLVHNGEVILGSK